MTRTAPVDLDIAALGRRAEAMLHDLARISAEPDRLVRLFLSPEHRAAADLVGQWMRAAGLEVSEDALGTVRGRYDAPGPKRRLLIGSHIDTVVGAGKYDGTFGVVAGILALDRLRTAGGLPNFGVDVLAFGDEEGSRFPATLASSSACAGVFRTETLALADAKGTTLYEALAAWGQGGDAAVAASAYDHAEVAAFVEAHIEQGPVLESRNLPLGVVSAIVGQTYLNVEWLGEAGHAGTVPMLLRRDALAGAADAVQLAERLARESRSHWGAEVLATVGRLLVTPNATNVIPGHVVMVVDIRSGDEAARAAFVEAFKAGVREIADRRHLGLTVTSTREVATTPCHPALQEGLAAALHDLGVDALALPSGAGHDGQAMARLCPIGMLFVRCRGGISHNPMEYASPQDLGLAIAALIRFIERFDPDRIA